MTAPKHGGGLAREFEFTAADFERVRRLIHARAGIALSEAKQDMVYSRLARRLRAHGDRSFAQYLERLERGDAGEWETFINALTTNLTAFFREAHHFETLAAYLKSIGDKRAVRIWCSAASTGEEPYSIAMTAIEAFNTPSPPVAIVASDLDTNVLSQGARGIYPAERVGKLSAERIARHFRKADAAGDSLQVRPELRRLITFSRINLLDRGWSLQGPFDAIFCRNVMIYFDKPTQYGILQRFLPLLREDGLLFAGHSENFMHATDLFRSIGRTTYVPARGRPAAGFGKGDGGKAAR